MLTETFPQMGAAALALVAGGGELPTATEEAPPSLDSEEMKRILFDGLAFPDEFSGRTARMRSLYSIAQEMAAQLFSEDNISFEPRKLEFLNDRYMATVTTEHQFRSQFLRMPWTVHEAVAPSSTNPVVYANAENGNPWLSTSDPRADMEFTLMSAAAQLQGASEYRISPGITFPDKNAYASWGGYVYTNSEKGPALLHRFADGMNIYAARSLIFKRHMIYLLEHHGIESTAPFYQVSQFHAFAEFPVIDMLHRLNLPAEELARVACRDGASAMMSLIESTYTEWVYDTATGIDAHTAAGEILEVPELQSGDDAEQRLTSYNTVVLAAIDRLLPPTITPEQQDKPSPDPRTLALQGNFVFTVV